MTTAVTFSSQNRELKQRWRWGQRKRPKKKCLDWQNNSSAGASLHEHEVKMPNSTFCGGREQSLQHRTFFFFSWTLIQSSRIELHSQKLPAFDELNEARWNKGDKVWSSATWLFKWRFRSRRRRCSLSFLRTHYVVSKKPRPRTLTRLNRPRVI